MKFSNNFKRIWWGLLLLATSFFLYKRLDSIFTGAAVTFDIFLFLIWTVLMLAPVFSEISLFGMSFKQVKDEISKEVTSVVKNVIRQEAEEVSVDEDLELPTAMKDAILKQSLLSAADSTKFVEAIFNGKFTRRTIDGIASESGISRPDLTKVLNVMIDFGLIEKSVGFKGNDLFSPKKYPIKIYSATYGAGNVNSVDVTKKIDELVASRIFTGNVSPAFLGVIDPAYGTPKVLTIHLRYYGKEEQRSYADGNVFKLIGK